jgi:hypothetical protein
LQQKLFSEEAVINKDGKMTQKIWALARRERAAYPRESVTTKQSRQPPKRTRQFSAFIYFRLLERSSPKNQAGSLQNPVIDGLLKPNVPGL